MRNAMAEVVLVKIAIHPNALAPEALVVLRTGQRSEKEEFENVDRQFALDDFNIAQDRLLTVTGEAEDIARADDCAVLAPFLQHGAIVGNLVLSLLGADQIVGVDVLEPDEHAPGAAFGRLLE